MTTIKEFRITSLAGRKEDLHCTLDPQVNIFWGLNGTGKTTLLRILNAALSNKTVDLDALPFDAAEVRYYSEFFDMDIVRTFDKVNMIKREPVSVDRWASPSDLDFDDDVTYNFARREADPGWRTEPAGMLPDDDLGAFKHRYLPISRMLDAGRPEPHMSEVSADERFIRRVNTVWSQYSSRSLAAIRDIQQLGLAEVLAILFGGTGQPEADSVAESNASIGRETSAEEAYGIVSDFLTPQRILLPLGKGDFMARYDDSPQHRHVVTRIQSVMKQIDRVLAPQMELQAVIEEMYIGNKHLVLHRSGSPRGKVAVEIDQESIPLASLSSGEKQLLQLLLETLAVAESTIMIDEPEISLHPDWQLGLVESMRRVNPNAQFILATHSPELMVGVPDDCVFEL